MASYAEAAMMSQHSPPHTANMLPQYPPPPDSSPPNNAPFPPQIYPNTDPALHPAPVPISQTPSNQKPPKGQGQSDSADGKEYRNRLRKACDSCSIRKVKCDETQPCKACRSLDIPCTFERPSKRRGPPNRHADAIKKQRLEAAGDMGPSADMGPSHHSQASSPTHAAQTLASFARQQVLSAESIAPWNVLQHLIDDYFFFIHPLIPVPHEPSFRAALARREDVSNPTFLALLASMIGCLVASFPRRPREHLRNLSMDHLFPNSLSVVDRCHKVAMEAKGSATHNRTYTVHDAIISYLQGLTTGYMFNRDSCLVYFQEGLTICTNLGLHRAPAVRSSEPNMPRMTPNGQTLEGPQPNGGDLLLQELGRRTFWLLFTGFETIRQLGCSPDELRMPPASKLRPYPPLPLEVDDAYLSPTGVIPQPEGYISELTGFNINVRVFMSYQKLNNDEWTSQEDEVLDWESKKAKIEESLKNVKLIIEELPPQLQIPSETAKPKSSRHRYPSLDHEIVSPNYQSNGTISGDFDAERTHVQHEIQKANIYASQLGTRSYLVEKYSTLNALRHLDSTNETFSPSKTSTAISPSLSKSSPPALTPLTDADGNPERSNIIRDFLQVLENISQANMEPNGASFIHKIRAIATNLLDVNQVQQQRSAPSSIGATANQTIGNGDDFVLIQPLKAQKYLQAFASVLQRLENAVPPNQTPSVDDEALQLKQWADLWEEQQRFAQSGGWMSL